MLLTPLAMHAARSRPASERITIGMIGIGAMGRPHLDRLLGFEDVQVVAVCDVEKTRRETARAQVEKQRFYLAWHAVETLNLPQMRFLRHELILFAKLCMVLVFWFLMGEQFPHLVRSLMQF